MLEDGRPKSEDGRKKPRNFCLKKKNLNFRVFLNFDL